MIFLDDDPLPSTMNAVVLEQPWKLAYKEIPIWPIDEYKNSKDLLLVKVEACGVCGSDLRYYAGENPWAQHTLGRFIENKPNIVLGHEFAGTVVAVVDEKNKRWLGKRVVPICFKTCGSCNFCNTKRSHLCPHTIHLGHGQGWGDLPYYPGAYAEYVPVWSETCYEIPNNVTYEQAAMMDILAVCNHVLKRGRISEDLPILMIGCGPAGNGIAQIARILGVQQIIIIEKSSVAIGVAKKNEFPVIINSNLKSEAAIRDEIMALTGGYGCYSIFDSVGSKFSMDLAFSVLDKGGTIVNMAVHDTNIDFNYMSLSSERRITTSSNFNPPDFEEALSFLKEGNFNLEPWLTTISLKDAPAIYKTVVDENKKEYFKLVITNFR